MAANCAAASRTDEEEEEEEEEEKEEEEEEIDPEKTPSKTKGPGGFLFRTFCSVRYFAPFAEGVNASTLVNALRQFGARRSYREICAEEGGDRSRIHLFEAERRRFRPL
ncbi:hypothetical protein EAI_14071 [Harpegnathos saltator]|uniref:Uncharacterized protein n=1 Tax=Harpegnathos saltator TaxID=610380 RepID=E2C7Y1_HARSA|nr:hypothetical protein EAI_14071 [Harpegnathos saltator]